MAPRREKSRKEINPLSVVYEDEVSDAGTLPPPSPKTPETVRSVQKIRNSRLLSAMGIDSLEYQHCRFNVTEDLDGASETSSTHEASGLQKPARIVVVGDAPPSPRSPMYPPSPRSPKYPPSPLSPKFPPSPRSPKYPPPCSPKSHPSLTLPSRQAQQELRPTSRQSMYQGQLSPSHSDASVEIAKAKNRMEKVSTQNAQPQTWFQRHGGWYRVAAIACFLVIIGVGVGVGVTISMKNNKPKQDKASLSRRSAQSLTFSPAGSYAFTVALTNASAGCTTNPDTFGCFPFQVYDPEQAESESAVTFYWDITENPSGADGDDDDAATYSISSSTSTVDDGYAPAGSMEQPPSFDHLDLVQLDRGLATERLTFSFSTNLTYTPSSSEQTSCHYRQVVFSATLWTRERANFPSSLASAGSLVSEGGSAYGKDDSYYKRDKTAVDTTDTTVSQYRPWPFVAEISEVRPASTAAGTTPGCEQERLLATHGSTASQTCGCWYTNAISSD